MLMLLCLLNPDSLLNCFRLCVEKLDWRNTCFAGGLSNIVPVNPWRKSACSGTDIYTVGHLPSCATAISGQNLYINEASGDHSG